ncbi:MAG: DoxX family protein [Chloroflexota bacterium]|nr:DoxX family protein [Chloroflexota bacterium]
MLTQTNSRPAVKPTIWAGRVLSAIAILFLAFDTIIKVLNLPSAVEATTQLGYGAGQVVTIGIIELVCLALYVIPRTAVLGALLLTGYLGGAVAIHMRAASGFFPLVFPLIIGTLIWGGLLLRDQRLSELMWPQP